MEKKSKSIFVVTVVDARRPQRVTDIAFTDIACRSFACFFNLQAAQKFVKERGFDIFEQRYWNAVIEEFATNSLISCPLQEKWYKFLEDAIQKETPFIDGEYSPCKKPLSLEGVTNFGLG